MIEVKITYEVFSKDGFSICSCAVLSGAEEIPDFVGNKNSIKIKGNFPVSKNVNLKVDGRWEKYKTGEFTLIVDTFEITHLWQSNRDQTFEELVHSFATQCHTNTDR